MKKEWFGMRWKIRLWSISSMAVAMMTIFISGMITLLRAPPSELEGGVGEIYAFLIASIATITLAGLSSQTQAWSKHFFSSIAIGFTAIASWGLLFLIARDTLFAILGISVFMLILAFVGQALIVNFALSLSDTFSGWKERINAKITDRIADIFNSRLGRSRLGKLLRNQQQRGAKANSYDLQVMSDLPGLHAHRCRGGCCVRDMSGEGLGVTECGDVEHMAEGSVGLGNCRGEGIWRCDVRGL